MQYNMLKANLKNTGIKYHSGVIIPRTSQYSLGLGASEGTVYWADEMEKGKKNC